MNIHERLLSAIEQLSDEQLSILLKVALSLKSGKIYEQPIVLSQGYRDWLSAENDIYDELLYDAAKAGDDEVIGFEEAIAEIEIDRI